MENEIWKQMPLINDDRYEVSNHGRLRSFAKKYGRKEKPIILSQYSHRAGHKIVGLKINGNLSQVRVHRLVAIAFIENPNNYPHVLHYDDNPENNYVDNLRWGNDKMNQKDRRRNNGHHNEGEYHGMSKLTRKDVIEIKRLIHTTNIYYIHIAKQFNVVDSCIRSIKDGKSWTHIKTKYDDIPIPDRGENRFGDGHWNSKVFIHKETGKKFTCGKDAAKWAGVNYGTMISRLNRAPHLSKFIKQI